MPKPLHPRHNHTLIKSLCILIIFIAFAVGGFFIVKSITQTQNPNHSEQEQDPDPEPEPDYIQLQLDSMTLDEKVAQMLIVNSPAPAYADQELERLKSTPYGGYILMGSAYGTLADTRAMIEKYQKSAKTPLIITTDEEGGIVQRLQSLTDVKPTDIPDMYSVGETGDLEYAKTIGKVLAEELRTIGINVDMAPDADVFSNPYNTVIGRRSFSKDPEIVAKMSQALAEGLENNGVTATYKHFPGHGDTAVDSHKALPIINRTKAELDSCDLIPFKNAIEKGAKFIMIAHIAVPQITGDTTPATLSYKITTDLLRNELGYQNLIITDGLNMGALTSNYTEAEIYQKSVEAGADLLLLPEDPELAISTIKSTIPESRIDESVYRILKFKHNHLSNYKFLDSSYFGSSTHAEAVKYF